MMCHRASILSIKTYVNAATTALVIASFTFTWLNPSIATAAPDPHCSIQFAELLRKFKTKTQTLFFPGGQKIKVCGYKVGYCFENVLPVLEEVEKLKLPGPPAKVLFVTKIHNFQVHVIVEKNGMIYDPYRFAKTEGDVTLEGIPVARYFATAGTDPNSRVLEVPGEIYSRDFDSDSTWDRYTDYLRFGIHLPPGTQRHLTRRYLQQF